MADTWTVGRMLRWTTDYLQRKGDEHPRLSAEWLINNVTGLTRVEIYMNFDRPLDSDELSRMHDAVLRRGRGEPLQYVTGEMPFRHIVLRCERGVLIPRPETEILVDTALEGVDAAVAAGRVYDDVERRAEQRRQREAEERAVQREAAEEGQEPAGGEPEEPEDAISADEPQPVPAGPRVLEVGCGTGCIALSIASERPGSHVVTTDLSPQAIQLATRNRDALHLQDAVDVVQCDLASGVDEGLMGTFSVLVSNPPYIPSSVLPTLPQEVIGFEPGLALDGGEDGLDVYRRLLELSRRALAPGGMLCVELFEDSLDHAAELARSQGGWDRVEVREDLTHRPRVLVAVRED